MCIYIYIYCFQSTTVMPGAAYSLVLPDDKEAVKSRIEVGVPAFMGQS